MVSTQKFLGKFLHQFICHPSAMSRNTISSPFEDEFKKAHGAKASFFRCETQCWPWTFEWLQSTLATRPHKVQTENARRSILVYQMKSFHVCDRYMIYDMHAYISMIFIFIWTKESLRQVQWWTTSSLSKQISVISGFDHAFVNSSKNPWEWRAIAEQHIWQYHDGYTWIPLKCCSVIPWGPTNDQQTHVSDGHGPFHQRPAAAKKSAHATRVRSPSAPMWR